MKVCLICIYRSGHVIGTTGQTDTADAKWKETGIDKMSHHDVEMLKHLQLSQTNGCFAVRCRCFLEMANRPITINTKSSICSL